MSVTNAQHRFLETNIAIIVDWFDEHSAPLLKINESEISEMVTVITVEQLMEFLELKKFHRRNFHYPSYAEIMNQVEKFSLSSTRMLTREQFMYMLLEWALIPKIKHELLLAFQALDTEKRNFLDVNELKHIVTTYGDVLNKDEAIEFIRDADVKGDGYVYYADYIENLFQRFPELHDIESEYLYLNPVEDPSVLPESPSTPQAAEKTTKTQLSPVLKKKRKREDNKGIT